MLIGKMQVSSSAYCVEFRVACLVHRRVSLLLLCCPEQVYRYQKNEIDGPIPQFVIKAGTFFFDILSMKPRFSIFFQFLRNIFVASLAVGFAYNCRLSRFFYASLRFIDNLYTIWFESSVNFHGHRDDIDNLPLCLFHAITRRYGVFVITHCQTKLILYSLVRNIFQNRCCSIILTSGIFMLWTNAIEECADKAYFVFHCVAFDEG